MKIEGTTTAKVRNWIKDVFRKIGKVPDTVKLIILEPSYASWGIMEFEPSSGEIVIPKNAQELDEAHFKFALAHELAHAKNLEQKEGDWADIDKNKAELYADNYASKLYPMPKDWQGHKKKYQEAVKMRFDEKSETRFNKKPYKVLKIRQRKTKHEGGTPLTVPKAKKTNSNGETKMVEGTKQIMKLDTWADLAKMGASISIGMGTSRIVNGLVSGMIPEIPFRATIGSGIATAGLYLGYKNLPDTFGLKQFMKYAAAGSAAHTIGVAVGETLAMANIQLPGIANDFLGIATGVKPQVEMQETDLNTPFF